MLYIWLQPVHTVACHKTLAARQHRCRGGRLHPISPIPVSHLFTSFVLLDLRMAYKPRKAYDLEQLMNLIDRLNSREPSTKPEDTLEVSQ